MGHSLTFCKTCETPLDCDFCDKIAALIEPGCMTLEELRAEAKRQGYKLIKDKHPRFERCLCGHNATSGAAGLVWSRWSTASTAGWKAPGCVVGTPK